VDAAAGAGVPLAVNRVGSMLTPFFVRRLGQTVSNYTDATACDTQAYATFFHAMLDNGVHLAPSQYEAMFVGMAHKNDLIEETVRGAAKAFKVVAMGKTEAGSPP
jgi:glutamate-1-semialdehyde 2,1-aminomutase